jgi:hypothetical protein
MPIPEAGKLMPEQITQIMTHALLISNAYSIFDFANSNGIIMFAFSHLSGIIEIIPE